MEKEDYKKSIYDYQDVQDTIEYARERARAEGEARGRLDGLAEGEARGEARGRAEGIAEGEVRGRAEEKLAMAKGMLQKGIDMDTILSISGLSAEEICS